MARVRLAAVSILCLTGVLLAAQAPPADRAKTEAMSRRVKDRIRALQNEAERLAGQSRTLLGDLRALEIERDLQVERLGEAEARVAEAQAALNRTSARLTALETKRIAELPDLTAQLLELYKTGRSGNIRMLLGAENARDLGRATRAVASIVRLNEERVDTHRRTLAAMREEQKTLKTKVADVQRLRGEAQKVRAAAERAVNARGQLLTQIDARRDLNAQLMGELQVAQQQLNQTIASLRTGGSPPNVSVPIAAFRGTLEWPVVGPLNGRFGEAAQAAAGGTVRNGIEIGAPKGTPVRAVHSGTVSYADTFTGYGTLVIIDHGGGHYSLYGYLSALNVQRDEHVDAGDEVGRTGASPTGPLALYFEFRVDGRSVDPVQWLKSRS